jgi:hypothetical protein
MFDRILYFVSPACFREERLEDVDLKAVSRTSKVSTEE